MSELWIPQPEKKPDVANIFDMMLVFQEQIDNPEHYKDQRYIAQLAVDALSAALERIDKTKRTLNVVTELAIIDDHNDISVTLAKNIGLHGEIVDIHCVEIDDHVPMSITLDMDVERTFTPYNPDDTDYVFSYVRAPIAKVQYIETIAA